MTDLPSPLVPPEVDLRGFPAFPLDVDRLLSSELVAIGTPEECWAAVMLWCKAWRQTPPASLPDDDRILAAFSNSGKKWKKIRNVALHGFVKCSDGRLYHRVLAQVALEAFEKRQRYQALSAKGNSKRWGVPCGIPQGSETGQSGDPVANPSAIPQGSLGDRREEKEKRGVTTTGGTPPISPPSGGEAPKGAVTSKPKAVPFPVPEWVPATDWEAFVSHRKALKAPLTDEAKRRAIAELDRLRADGNDVSAVLSQSILNGWKGLFPVHDNGGPLNGTRRESAADRHQRANAIHEQALALAAAELGGRV